MSDSTVHDDANAGLDDASVLKPMRSGWRTPTVRVVAAIAIVVALGDVVYQRVGTTAQADTIEYTRNLSGGFMAVGMTEQHPGFIVLSALDRDRVDVDALFYQNLIAGDSTVAVVRTGHAEWQARLRGPVVVLVSPNGAVKSESVNWSWRAFDMIRQGTDCANAVGDGPHRCGAPFADFFDLVSGEGLGLVPSPVRRFLAPFARPAVTRADRVDAHTSRRSLALDEVSE